MQCVWVIESAGSKKNQLYKVPINSNFTTGFKRLVSFAAAVSHVMNKFRTKKESLQSDGNVACSSHLYAKFMMNLLSKEHFATLNYS